MIVRAGVSGPAWVSVWLSALLEGRRDQPLRVAPIAHSGELLGLIVADRPTRGTPFVERDDRVLAELARQVGFALRNVRLDSQLQASLDEVRDRPSSSAPPARASSRPPMPSGGESSAVFTTALSSNSLRSARTCASRVSYPVPTRSRRRLCWNSSETTSWRRSRSFESLRTASTRRSSPIAALPKRSPLSQLAPLFPLDSRRWRSADTRRSSRRRCISAASKRCRMPGSTRVTRPPPRSASRRTRPV